MTRGSALGKKGRHATLKQISTPQQLTMGLSQGSPLYPVLYTVHTKRQVDLDKDGFSQVLTLAGDWLLNKTASDANTQVTAVQEQLDKLSQWYQETGSEISPSKEKALCCTFNNKAVGSRQSQQSPSTEKTQNARTASDISGSTSTDSSRTRRRFNKKKKKSSAKKMTARAKCHGCKRH